MKLPAFATGMIAAICFATPAFAQNAAVEAPIKTFADAFNKGDIAGAKATMSARVSIVDEVAPFQWRGDAAFDDWTKSYDKDAAAKGITEPQVAVGAPTRELIDGTAAYVIVPAIYTFKQKGVAMSETAQMTFTLIEWKGVWKITGWTWTGPDATPVKN